MTGHACLQSTSYFFPALTLLTFWVTFCVTFHLTNTIKTMEMIQGDLPKKAQELVTEWLSSHQDELQEMWDKQEIRKLPPL